MAVTASETVVVQEFKVNVSDATSATLIPSTKTWGEAKPTHLASTQVVFTYGALPENLWGVIAGNGANDVIYRITVERVGG